MCYRQPTGCGPSFFFDGPDLAVALAACGTVESVPVHGKTESALLRAYNYLQCDRDSKWGSVDARVMWIERTKEEEQKIVGTTTVTVDLVGWGRKCIRHHWMHAYTGPRMLCNVSRDPNCFI
jgi:hypothetical protein